jgi:riboflavin synthase
MLNSVKPHWQVISLPALLTVMFIALPGCSSAPKPVAELSAAETALSAAENEDATKYAPVRMDRARQKIKQAKLEMAKENYTVAKRLAEEAQADAEMAKAITGKAEADRAVSELENSIKVLREEIMRARQRQ